MERGGEVRDVSGTRGRGERDARSSRGRRVTGRDGGWRSWGVIMMLGAGGYWDGWMVEGWEGVKDLLL